MDSYSITNVKYLDPSELHRWMIEGHTTTLQEPFQVVDVRGSDYMGGHIRDGWHFAYSRLKQDPGYLRELKRRPAAEAAAGRGGRRRAAARSTWCSTACCRNSAGRLQRCCCCGRSTRQSCRAAGCGCCAAASRVGKPCTVTTRASRRVTSRICGAERAWHVP